MGCGRNARLGGVAVCCIGLGAACAAKSQQPPPAAPAPPSASPGEKTQLVQDNGELPIDKLLSPEPAETEVAPQAPRRTDSEQTAPVLSGVHGAAPSGRASAARGKSRPVQDAVPSSAVVGKGLSMRLTRGIGDEADRELSLGDVAYASSDYARALSHYRKARRMIPKEPQPLVGISIARLAIYGIPTEFAGAPKEPRIRELRRLLDQALKLEPNFGPAHLQLGRLLLIQGEGKKAAASLARAVRALPNNPEAHSAVAVAALSQGEISEAVAGFERAAELEPNQAERLTNLGTAYMMHGDAQRAISAYRRAVSIAPSDPRARGDLGTALLATHNVKGALPHLERAHALAPERATFMSNLGYAHQQQGDVPTAIAWYEKALAKDPKLGSAWINLGIARAKQGDFDAAERAFRHALKLDPTDPRAKANLQELKEARTAQP